MFMLYLPKLKRFPRYLQLSRFYGSMELANLTNKTFNCNTYIHNYAYTWRRPTLQELKTLDIGTRLFDNAAFVDIQVMGTFSEDFLEVRGLRGRGSQPWLI